jgi:hypothetical protein
MERINLSSQEIENQSPKSITDQIRLQLESIRDEALTKIKELETVAHDTQDKLESVDSIQDTPHIILKVDHLEVEYDIYTWSESIKSTTEYIARTDNIEEAIELCAQQVSSYKDVSLGGLGLEIPNETPLYIALKNSTSWQQLFARRQRALYEGGQRQNNNRR